MLRSKMRKCQTLRLLLRRELLIIAEYPNQSYVVRALTSPLSGCSNLPVEGTFSSATLQRYVSLRRNAISAAWYTDLSEISAMMAWGQSILSWRRSSWSSKCVTRTMSIIVCWDYAQIQVSEDAIIPSKTSQLINRIMVRLWSSTYWCRSWPSNPARSGGEVTFLLTAWVASRLWWKSQWSRRSLHWKEPATDESARCWRWEKPNIAPLLYQRKSRKIHCPFSLLGRTTAAYHHEQDYKGPQQGNKVW